ncbi:protein-glutamate O-methyltransferase CheR [Ectothiorhodospiraceae bacterium BW-2]|nr:protein-glutamate O-methyltransferase CheR [Ectothiorhodospiraceae bacterium BW-2]
MSFNRAVGDKNSTISELSDAEFARFRDFFYRKTGIYFEESKRYFVDKRVIQRIEATASDSFRDYFTLLRFQASGEELQQLINLLTVNETYFFREEYQFQCMVRSVLPEIVRHKPLGERMRIWSIPSSTGEEPYSVALYLLEHWADINRIDVELTGSDIDSRVLERAQKGIFNARSVNHLPRHILNRYFTPLVGDNYQISTDLRESVEFKLLNLTDGTATRYYRNYDVIFCRNLLIYFDDTSRRQAAESLFDALRPGGFLFLGHSESMSRISSLFTVRKFPEAIAYQKPLS